MYSPNSSWCELGSVESLPLIFSCVGKYLPLYIQADSECKNLSVFDFKSFHTSPIFSEKEMEDNQIAKQATHEDGECSETKELVQKDNQCEHPKDKSRKKNPKEPEDTNINKRHKYSRHSKSEHTASRGVFQELYLRLRGLGRLSDLPRYCLYDCLYVSCYMRQVEFETL